MQTGVPSTAQISSDVKAARNCNCICIADMYDSIGDWASCRDAGDIGGVQAELQVQHATTKDTRCCTHS